MNEVGQSELGAFGGKLHFHPDKGRTIEQSYPIINVEIDCLAPAEAKLVISVGCLRFRPLIPQSFQLMSIEIFAEM